MSQPLGESERRRSGTSYSRLRAPLAALLLGSPPALLATAAISGIGLSRQLSATLAISSGVCLTLLPILGLSSLTRRWRASLLASAWLWSLLLLTALPFYFPGERRAATAAGGRLLASPLGAEAADTLGALAGALVSRLGRDGASPPETILSGGEGPAPERGERMPNGAALERSGGLRSDGSSPEVQDRVILLPYQGDERSLRVSVDIDGPRIGEQFEMIFDTGATYTTLSHQALQRLDVSIPSDAPSVTLHTANGEIQARLVLIDAIWLGEAVVEWVTVAVCDGCSNRPAVGLLGLNVSRQFRVTLNHDRRSIELRPRRHRSNRQLDVSQWLEIHSGARRAPDGSIRLELTGQNRSQREIESTVIELRCGEQSFAIQLDHIPPHGEASTELPIPHGTDCSRHFVSLSRGSWVLDRF